MSSETAPDLTLVVPMLEPVVTEQRAIRTRHSRFGTRFRELATTVNEKLAP